MREWAKGYFLGILGGPTQWRVRDWQALTRFARLCRAAFRVALDVGLAKRCHLFPAVWAREKAAQLDFLRDMYRIAKNRGILSRAEEITYYGSVCQPPPTTWERNNLTIGHRA